ncbi:MAG: hypothetical protein AABX66_01770 [Nanoarchaeota archaeon]
MNSLHSREGRLHTTPEENQRTQRRSMYLRIIAEEVANLMGKKTSDFCDTITLQNRVRQPSKFGQLADHPLYSQIAKIEHGKTASTLLKLMLTDSQNGADYAPSLYEVQKLLHNIGNSKLPLGYLADYALHLANPNASAQDHPLICKVKENPKNGSLQVNLVHTLALEFANHPFYLDIQRHRNL